MDGAGRRIFRERGGEHERAVLERFRADGLAVEISPTI
jgi:hypothetical protein